jgi:4-alpha-glucanotransferase
MKLHFYLRFNTKPGQSLFITGNIPELGLENTQKPSEPVALRYMSPEFWQLSIDLLNKPHSPVQYRYLLKTEDGTLISEWGKDREIPDLKKQAAEIQTIDTWNYAGEYENAFYSTPFQKHLLPSHKKSGAKTPREFTHIFKVKAPLLTAGQCLCLAGSGEGLKDWSVEDPILMKKEGNWWTASVNLPR